MADKSHTANNIIEERHEHVTEELASLGFCKEVLTSLGRAINTARLINYEPGDTIYNEGAEVEALYVIRNGRIKLMNFLENGRARIVRLHNRGSTLGLNGLMDETHSHTAEAIDTVQAYQLSMPLINSIKEDDPEAYCSLLEYFHEYLNIADTWIKDFSTGAIRGRVARLIRYLTEQDQSTGPKEVKLLTVEEMADILGVTPESVSRIMADLKRKKILQVIENDKQSDHYKCDTDALEKEAEK